MSRALETASWYLGHGLHHRLWERTTVADTGHATIADNLKADRKDQISVYKRIFHRASCQLQLTTACEAQKLNPNLECRSNTSLVQMYSNFLLLMHHILLVQQPDSQYLKVKCRKYTSLCTKLWQYDDISSESTKILFSRQMVTLSAKRTSTILTFRSRSIVAKCVNHQPAKNHMTPSVQPVYVTLLFKELFESGCALQSATV